MYDMHIAIKNGNLELVKSLIAVAKLTGNEVALCNLMTKSGDTPITLAASGGHIAIMEELIKNGVNIDACRGDLSSALNCAAMNSDTDTVLYLLGKGANINSKNDIGNTPLHHAAINRHYKTISILLDNGADKTILNIVGKTAAEHHTSMAKYIDEYQLQDIKEPEVL